MPKKKYTQLSAEQCKDWNNIQLAKAAQSLKLKEAQDELELLEKEQILFIQSCSDEGIAFPGGTAYVEEKKPSRIVDETKLKAYCTRNKKKLSSFQFKETKVKFLPVAKIAEIVGDAKVFDFKGQPSQKVKVSSK